MKQFNIGQNVTFTQPGNLALTNGTIKRLNDDGSYEVGYVIPETNGYVEISVRPELINEFNPEAVQADLQSLIQKKAAFYGGFVVDKPETVEFFK